MSTYDDIDRATRADAARDRVVKAAMKYAELYERLVAGEPMDLRDFDGVEFALFQACRELKETKG